MLTAIRQRINNIGAGERQGKQRLRIVPVIGPSHDRPEYRLLESNILDKVRVTEIDQSGAVPVLKVHNGLDVRVFLMDGQELLGAKQNRILNTDVLVPASTTISIPVSCVEQGRWRHTSPQFMPGKAASYSVRRGKSQRVHESLKGQAGHDADQSAVWDEVQFSIALAGASSPTSALSDAYTARQKDLQMIRQELQLPENAVGVAVFIGSELRGIDVFDRHSTLRYFWESLLDSYAIDSLAEPFDPQSSDSGPDQVMVRSTLEQVAEGQWDGFDSPGEGRDYRLEHPQFTGSALVWQDEVVVHLQMFPRKAQEEGGTPRRPRVRRVY